MTKRRRFLQVFLAVLVVALSACAAHACNFFEYVDASSWEEVWVVDGPGGPYGVGIPFFSDDYITVYVGPRSFTVPLGPQKLAVAAGGLLLVIGLVTGGTCALWKDRKVSA